MLTMSKRAVQSAVAIMLLTLVYCCQKNVEKKNTTPEEIATKAIPPKDLKDFTQVNLVGDNDEYNPARIDPTLINAWGISFPTSGPAWVSSEGAGLSTVYLADGNSARPNVVIPPAGPVPSSHPTGQVFNATNDFKLPNGNPARFIFATAEGGVSGWNAGNVAIKKVDAFPDAAFLGIALANDGTGNFLYVANFKQGKINVYDKDWVEVNNKPFVDPDIPAGFSPYNIQAIDGKLYVMYAQVDPADGHEAEGPGLGYVNVFNPDGSFVKRFVSRGQLNAPWGIAKAPTGFWGEGTDNANVFLIGNFGDGRINAFDEDGNFLGQLRSHGNPIEIEGLWGIAFAPSTSTAINRNWLFFAAGPDNETHGLFGYIKK